MIVNIDRRSFISGVIGIALAQGLVNPQAATIVDAIELNNTSLLASVQRVGVAYLRLRPWEAERKKLFSLIQHSLSTAGGMQESTAKGGWNPQQLKELIAGDFSAGNIVNLDGWIVSETECRLCALSYVDI